MTPDELAEQLAEFVSDGIMPEIKYSIGTYSACYPEGTLKRTMPTYQTRLAKLDYELLEMGHDLLAGIEYLRFEAK